MTWTRQPTGTLAALFGLACADVSTCLAVGLSGAMLETHDSGKNWTIQPTATEYTLWSVVCPTTATCYAVGDNGTILRGSL